mmetsp:Transcript_34158/g.82593  ORF Transcript_34158/g.82593 Transcript_34158/m.82593 type:complete len:343 (+) Transcript_34158:100-1128(+)
MDTTATTTWYAFQDPKTNREYFHEPVSGKTSWVLPTSNSTQIVRAEKNHHDSTANDSKALKSDSVRSRHKAVAAPSQNKQKHHDATANSGHKAIDARSRNKQKQSRGWGAVGITFVSILFFNTMFLLVLVKALYDNSNGPIQIRDQIKDADRPIQTHETKIKLKLSSDDAVGPAVQKEEKLSSEANPRSLSEVAPISPSTRPNNETKRNHTVDSSCMNNPEEPSASKYSSNDATEYEDMHHFEPRAANNEERTPDKLLRESGEESIRQSSGDIVKEERNPGDQQEGREKRIGKQSHHFNLKLKDAAWICWVPFSYILFEKCRLQAREGLPMPLADVENSLWI